MHEGRPAGGQPIMDDASTAAGADTGEQVALVLVVVLVGWLKRQFVHRWANLDAAAAFRWSPDTSSSAFDQHLQRFSART